MRNTSRPIKRRNRLTKDKSKFQRRKQAKTNSPINCENIHLYYHLTFKLVICPPWEKTKLHGHLDKQLIVLIAMQCALMLITLLHMLANRGNLHRTDHLRMAAQLFAIQCKLADVAGVDTVFQLCHIVFEVTLFEHHHVVVVKFFWQSRVL